MVVLNYTESRNGLLDVRIRCSNCGVVGNVSVGKLSSIREYQCKFCNKIEKCKSSKNNRKYAGIQRICSLYYQLHKNRKIEDGAFENTEDFVRWSVLKGYRDYKVIRPAAGKEMVGRDAVFVYSRTSLRKKKEACLNFANDYEDSVKLIGSSLEDIVSSLDKCIGSIDNLICNYKKNNLQMDSVRDLYGKLSDYKEDINTCLAYMDKRIL